MPNSAELAATSSPRSSTGVSGAEVSMNQALPANVSIWVQDVRKLFPVQKGLFVRGKLQHVHAVDHLDFYIQEGESFGLVGESGCGKTTTGSLLVRVLQPPSGHHPVRR